MKLYLIIKVQIFMHFSTGNELRGMILIKRCITFIESY